MACTYQSMLGCKVCSHPLYRTCEKFVKARSAFLVRALQPFKFSRQSFRGSVVYSTDANKAKSAIAQVAIKKNLEVTKYSLSQVLSIVLDGSEIPLDTIFYVDASKVTGDPEKVMSVAQSFISKVENNRGFVSFLVKPTAVSWFTDYYRL